MQKVRLGAARVDSRFRDRCGAQSSLDRGSELWLPVDESDAGGPKRRSPHDVRSGDEPLAFSVIHGGFCSGLTPQLSCERVKEERCATRSATPKIARQLQRSLDASGTSSRPRGPGALALRCREVVEHTEQVAVRIRGGELVKTPGLRLGRGQQKGVGRAPGLM